MGLDTRQWLIDSSGQPVNISLLRRGDRWGTLRDLLSCTWIRNGVIKFELRRPRTSAVRRAVSILCNAMVCNYPELQLRPHATMHLRPIGEGASVHYSWRLTISADGVIFSDATLELPAHPVESR